MKVIQINATCGTGSTGKICVDISEALNGENIENYILYCSGKSDYFRGIKCADRNYIKFQALKSRIFGNYGFNSDKSTKKMIEAIEKIKPDIIHLHNIHGHDCNLEKLFNYLKKRNIKIFWTFHDCWAFTAYCPHFTMAKCEKWKEGCKKCILSKEFSWFFDKSSSLYKKKQILFSNLDMTIITPSKWLASIVKQSFLKNYPVKVINNGINLSIFKPTQNTFRQKNNISGNKFIVLGVAFDWGEKKGLDVFIELSKRLDKEKYQIVLVGTNTSVDKKLPTEIISIHRTQNKKELAEIYTAADIFVNPTREDSFPTVNIEALACGTPVITFNTGGSPEILNDKCGLIVEYNDIEGLEKEIVRICKEQPYTENDCIKRAAEFNKDEKFKEYINLYKSIYVK